jgi:hypothetical protein
MLTNAEVANLASNNVFLTHAQVASVIKANEIVSIALDGSVRARKRNSLAQTIIENARIKAESFAWALALNSAIQAELTFDGNNPVISDATLLVATGEVWDNIASVITGDEVIPEPFVPPTA